MQLRLGPVDIDPVSSCDGLGNQAIAACADAGADPLAVSGPAPSWIQCAALHGLIYRGRNTVTTVDPRDEARAMRPGEMRLDCDEGYDEALFDNTL